MTTEPARAMREIVQTTAPVLKAAGFRKRRYCFNRVTPSGIVHVVFFWQAPKEPPAWTEIPGLRERLYGTFRVEFGVHIPEITRNGVPRSDWIHAYDCQLRATISELTGVRGDHWHPLDAPDAAQWAIASVEQHGLPWLERFADHDGVLAAFAASEHDEMGMTPAAALDIAQLLATMGRGDDERALLEGYLSTPVSSGHADYLRRYLPTIGHPDLLDSLRIEQ